MPQNCDGYVVDNFQDFLRKAPDNLGALDTRDQVVARLAWNAALQSAINVFGEAEGHCYGVGDLMVETALIPLPQPVDSEPQAYLERNPDGSVQMHGSIRFDQGPDKPSIVICGLSDHRDKSTP